MIKDLCFTGKYQDKKLTIEAMLVNPAEYNRGDELLLFSLQIRGNDNLEASRFSFYITGKNN